MKKRFQLRESESFLERIRDVNNLPEGVDSPSDLYRKGARILLNNPDLLFGRGAGVSSVSQEMLDSMEDNIVHEIRLNREEINNLRLILSSLDPGREKEQQREKEAERIVNLLLKKPGLFEVGTVSELESFYDFEFWTYFTSDILKILRELGFLRVLPGERIVWTKKS